MAGVVVRAVRADEWERVRDFRLEAAARPEEFWRRRALAGSEDAGADAGQRSFVADWTSARGIRDLQLFVHVENPRAQRAYEKSGFEFTGETIELGDERELTMVRRLPAS